MGLGDLEWRLEPRAPRRGARRWALIAVLGGLVAAVGIAPTLKDRVLREPVAAEPAAPRAAPLTGSPYAADDPWRDWLADEQACPGGESTTLSSGQQLQVMRCLMNYARRRQGLSLLTVSTQLSASSGLKAAAIARCGTFEHAACGRPADEGARGLGVHGGFGENLYVAEGPLRAPRVALDGWLNSPGHRENLFWPTWKTAGIALLQGATFGRFRDSTIWVMQFGDR
jgi:uncharacterized protein YkwD